MRKVGWMAASAAIFIGGGAIASWVVESPEVPDRDLSGLTGDIDRGAYVARLAGCIGCHTDVEGGGAVLAGGAEIGTDFGSFYAPNITPHPEDGIGGWSLDDFARALTAGESPTGEHYFPSFPYTFYTGLTNQDIVDLWAAVGSVPAVAGGPPPHGLKFPFGFHDGVGGWKRMFFEPGELETVAETAEIAFVADDPGGLAATLSYARTRCRRHDDVAEGCMTWTRRIVLPAASSTLSKPADCQRIYR